jgi:hypothetical protein
MGASQWCVCDSYRAYTDVILVCVRALRLLQLESSCQNSVMRVRRSRQVELLHHILARSRAKPEEVQGLRERDESKGVCLGNIRDCGMRNMRNGRVMIINPREEEKGGYEGVKLKVDWEAALLKGSKLGPF